MILTMCSLWLTITVSPLHRPVVEGRLCCSITVSPLHRPVVEGRLCYSNTVSPLHLPGKRRATGASPLRCFASLEGQLLVASVNQSKSAPDEMKAFETAILAVPVVPVVQTETTQPLQTSQQASIAVPTQPTPSALTPNQREEPLDTRNKFSSSASYDPWGADNSGTANDGWGWGDNTETITDDAQEEERRKPQAEPVVEHTPISESNAFVLSNPEHLENHESVLDNKQVLIEQKTAANTKESSSYDPWEASTGRKESMTEQIRTAEAQAFVSSTTENLEKRESEMVNEQREQVPQENLNESATAYDPWGATANGALKDDGWGWGTNGETRISESQPEVNEGSSNQYDSAETTRNLGQTRSRAYEKSFQ